MPAKSKNPTKAKSEQSGREVLIIDGTLLSCDSPLAKKPYKKINDLLKASKTEPLANNLARKKSKRNLTDVQVRRLVKLSSPKSINFDFTKEYIPTHDTKIKDGIIEISYDFISIIAPELLAQNETVSFQEVYDCCLSLTDSEMRDICEKLLLLETRIRYEFVDKATGNVHTHTIELVSQTKLIDKIKKNNHNTDYFSEEEFLKDRISKLPDIFSEADEDVIAELQYALSTLKNLQENPPSKSFRRSSEEREKAIQLGTTHAAHTKLVDAGFKIEPELREILSIVSCWYGKQEKNKLIREAVLPYLIEILKQAISVANSANDSKRDLKAKI